MPLAVVESVIGFTNLPTAAMILAAVFYSFNILSAILVAGFTLDLRRKNSESIEANTVSLPTLQFRSVLQHVHQSVLVEMRTPQAQDVDSDRDIPTDDITRDDGFLESDRDNAELVSIPSRAL